MSLCLHRWDCDGMRPEAGCLGASAGCSLVDYLLRAGCWVRTEVPFPSRTS